MLLCVRASLDTTLVKMNDYMPHVFSISKAPMHNAKQQNHHRTSHRLQCMEAPVFITCNMRTARHVESIKSRERILKYRIDAAVRVI